MTDLDISKFAFFKDMKEEYRQIFLKNLTKDVFKPNEYIVKQNEHASKFFLIVKGKVSIEMLSPEGKPFSIQTLKEGDIVGWSWMIPPFLSQFSVRALEATEMLVIDGEMLRQKSEKDHDLGYDLLKRLVTIFVLRLQATRQHLMALYSSV
ncbi:MAG: cyclic nucleotide-binding domain-containing protein [Candidatus Omnitrophica bacterium]|nr:cyclic nucleotide-binding domain-containing protein [Candidatus Omnitrophota bacterium]